MTAAASAISLPPAAGVDAWGYKLRPVWMPIPFLIPMAICGVSYTSGGIPAFTDMGMVGLTVCCAFFLALELLAFPRRFGIGGLVLFGGTIIWFCEDYLSNWYGFNFRGGGIPYGPYVFAKQAFFYCFFVAMMTIGLMIQRGDWMVKRFHAIPEPWTPNFYFMLVLFLFFLGMIPYLFFTREAFLVSLWKDMISGRGGRGVQWTVGRTGNLNYAWGGYVAEFLNVGMVAGQLAGFYAILIARKTSHKVVGYCLWGVQMGLAFGSGTRSQVVFVGLPILATIFLRLQCQAVMAGRRLPLKAYVPAGILLLIMLVMVQIQGQMRNQGFREVDLKTVSYTDLEGNSMFSEGLSGFSQIPEEKPFFANNTPGEAIIRPIPETLFYFVIHPIPRALWHNKPVDPLWAWYNEEIAGTTGVAGTTVSKGLVGWWYFRYGIFGVIEGGIFWGWLMGVTERALQRAQGRPFAILVSFMFVTWLFKCYRDVGYLDIWAFMVTCVVIWAIMRFYRMMYPAPPVAAT